MNASTQEVDAAATAVACERPEGASAERVNGRGAGGGGGADNATTAIPAAPSTGGDADGGKPAPYAHQVGGHGAMVSLGGRLLKPLSRKELAFYTRLWDEEQTGPPLHWLRTFTPRFFGVYRPSASAGADADGAAAPVVGLTPEQPEGGVIAARIAAQGAIEAAVSDRAPPASAAAAAPATEAGVSPPLVAPAGGDAAPTSGAPSTPRAPLTWDSDVAAMASSAMASSADPSLAAGQLVDDSPAAQEAAAAAVAAAQEELALGPAARLRRAVRVATISPWAERMQAQAAQRKAAAAAAAAEAAEAAAAAAVAAPAPGGEGDDASDEMPSVGGTSSSTSPRLPAGAAGEAAGEPAASVAEAPAPVASVAAAVAAAGAAPDPAPTRVPRVSSDVDPTGSLVMEDLVACFTYPCIMDIKVGIRHYDDDASPEKRDRHIRKAAATTSATVGIRVTGSQVYKADRGTLLFRDKYHGRRLREAQLAGELAHFFHDGTTLRSGALVGIIARLRALLEHVEAQQTFNFYSSSILLIYEGAADAAVDGRGADGGDGNGGAPPPAASHTDVRMIDFAHTQASRGTIDAGYALGLRNLVFLLEAVYRDNTAPV